MELKEVFEPIINFLKNFQKREKEELSKNKAKERLQLVLMQDRASVSPDFFEMMKKEIIDVIKKYIDIDEETLEVQLTRGMEGDGGTGPALYANIPIKNIKPIAKKVETEEEKIEKAEAEEQKTENPDVEEANGEEIANTIIEEIKTIAGEKQGQEKKQVDYSKNKKNKKQNKNNNNKVQEEKENIQNVEENAKEPVEEIVETAEVVEETQSNIDEAETLNLNDETNEAIESTDEKKNFKERITNIKGGMKEAFTNVKSSAKEGIEKIKSKVKAKN